MGNRSEVSDDMNTRGKQPRPHQRAPARRTRAPEHKVQKPVQPHTERTQDPVYPDSINLRAQVACIVAAAGHLCKDIFRQALCIGHFLCPIDDPQALNAFKLPAIICHQD